MTGSAGSLRRRGRRILVPLAVVFVLWLGVCYQVVQNPTVVTHPSAADAIVVLGPSTDERTDTAVALARSGLSHNVVLSNTAPDSRPRQFCANPPAGWSLVCFVPDPGTTRGEAEYIRDLAAQRGWTSLIVVTSRFHISRAQLIVQRCFHGRVQMVAAHESVSPFAWLYQYTYQSAGYVRATLHSSC